VVRCYPWSTTYMGALAHPGIGETTVDTKRAPDPCAALWTQIVLDVRLITIRWISLSGCLGEVAGFGVPERDGLP
jgi:hypothetical protein